MNPLARASRLLEGRLGQLQERITGGDETAWPEFATVAVALATVTAQVGPGSRGELLTTQQMAERLNLAPKTLLKRARKGEIRPALKRGKLIRWRGDEIRVRS